MIDLPVISQQVLQYLVSCRWLTDGTASERSLQYNYKCAAGLDIEFDDNGTAIQRFTGENCASIIREARKGDRIAHLALCEIAEALISSQKNMPVELSRYLLSMAKAGFKGKKGQHPVTDAHRNHAIFHAMEIAVKAGASPTRNAEQNPENPSAASLVSEALSRVGVTMGEVRVFQIWSRLLDVRERVGFNTSRKPPAVIIKPDN